MATVLRLAGARDLDVAFVEERLREATADEDRAAIWYLPALTFQAGYAKHEGRIQETEGEILQVSKGSGAAGLGVELTVNPLRGVYEQLAARQVRLARQAERRQAVDQSLAEAAVRFYELVKAEGLVRIAKDAVARSTELVRYYKRRVARGASVAADVARAEAQLARDEQTRYRAAQAVWRSSARLATALRLDPAVELHTPAQPVRMVRLVGESGAVQTRVARALSRRPEVGELSALRRAARRREDAAKWGPLVPELGLAAGFGTFGGGTGSNFSDFSERADYALFLRWRFEGLGLGERDRFRAARARRRQEHIRGVRLQDEIRREVVEQHSALVYLSQRIKTAMQEVAAARKSFELSEARVRRGAGIALEVFEAQRELTQATIQHLAAIIEYNQAQHEFLRILGGAPSFEENRTVTAADQP